MGEGLRREGITNKIEHFFIASRLLQAEVALKSLHIEIPSLFSVLEAKGVIKSCDRSPDRSHDLLSQYRQSGITFEDFCTLYCEIKYSQTPPTWGGPVFGGIKYLFSRLSWIGCKKLKLFLTRFILFIL